MNEVAHRPLVLKRERENKGKTLRELSKELGVHWSTVSYWENGIKAPREKNRIKLARIFDMPAEELLKIDE